MKPDNALTLSASMLQAATSSGGDRSRSSKGSGNKKRNSGSHESHDNFLTTVIPYNENDKPVDIATLQVRSSAFTSSGAVSAFWVKIVIFRCAVAFLKEVVSVS